MISGTKEEQKHLVYKEGMAFTRGGLSENQLVRKDVIASCLKFLLHGGTFGPFSHPTNYDAPHPILLALTGFGEIIHCIVVQTGIRCLGYFFIVAEKKQGFLDWALQKPPNNMSPKGDAAEVIAPEHGSQKPLLSESERLISLSDVLLAQHLHGGKCVWC